MLASIQMLVHTNFMPFCWNCNFM